MHTERFRNARPWLCPTGRRASAAVLSVLFVLLPSSSLSAQQASNTNTYRDAYDAGFQDGQLAGRADMIRRKRFDIEGKEEYQEGKSGFDPQIHDSDVYLLAYRRGFKDGYKEGFGIAQKQKEPNPAPPLVGPKFPPEIPRRTTAIDPSGRVVLPVGTLIRIRLLERVGTKTRERGDTFKGEVLEDVSVDDLRAIKKGTSVLGFISYLKRPGRIKGTGGLKLLFHELVLGGGEHIPIDATWYSIDEPDAEVVQDGEGTLTAEDSVEDDAKKMGASAAIGALIGLIAGGKKGSAIGAGAGAVIGLGGVLGTRGRDLEFPANTKMTIRLDRPAAIPQSRTIP